MNIDNLQFIIALVIGGISQIIAYSFLTANTQIYFEAKSFWANLYGRGYGA